MCGVQTENRGGIRTQTWVSALIHVLKPMYHRHFYLYHVNDVFWLMQGIVMWLVCHQLLPSTTIQTYDLLFFRNE